MSNMIEQAREEARKEKERIEKEQAELIRQEMTSRMKAGKMLQLAKDSLVTNLGSFVINKYDDFEEVMETFKKEKPSLYAKYFLKIQEQAFSLKEEKSVTVINNINNFSDDQLLDIMEGKVVDA